MNPIRRSSYAAAAAFLVCACAASGKATNEKPVSAAAVPGALRMIGFKNGPTQMKLDDLKRLGPQTIAWSHRGESFQYTGVPIDAVLAAAGFEPGPKEARPRDKRSGWRKVIVATAPDGYGAAYSCAELLPSMGPTRAYVVWERNGAPLPGDMGPLRVLVTTDAEGSRSIHGVESLQLIDLREPRM